MAPGLFYGDDFAKTDFNPDSFIHITDHTDESLMEKIKEIDNNESLYHELKNQPLFVQKPSIEKFLNFLDDIVLN